MSEQEIKQITFRMIARVETGLSFINDKYLVQQRNSSGPDTAWLQNVYILFSFYFEILLKSALVISQPFNNEKELKAKLKELGHDINAIGEKLGKTNLKNIGIENIFLKNGEYEIKTTDKLIFVKDFNDIRYDFIEGKIRSIPANEDSIIQESLDGAYEILKKIKDKHFNQ